MFLLYYYNLYNIKYIINNILLFKYNYYCSLNLSPYSPPSLNGLILFCSAFVQIMYSMVMLGYYQTCHFITIISNCVLRPFLARRHIGRYGSSWWYVLIASMAINDAANGIQYQHLGSNKTKEYKSDSFGYNLHKRYIQSSLWRRLLVKFVDFLIVYVTNLCLSY